MSDPSSSLSRVRARLISHPVSGSVLSAWGWIVMGVLLVVWVALTFVVWVVTLPFDKGRYWAGHTFRRICVVYTLLNPFWSFRVTGVKITDPRRPYVVVSNHESFADMFAICHLPWEMKWIAKDTFYKFPLIGWMMLMADDIKLVRGSKESIVRAMGAARDRLDKHVSVMVFPEGTRSRDGSLGEFKDGAFRLAIEAGVPILPLAVAGTREAINKGHWRFGVADAEVRVMAPIPTDGLTRDDIGALRDRTRGLIADALVDMKA